LLASNTSSSFSSYLPLLPFPVLFLISFFQERTHTSLVRIKNGGGAVLETLMVRYNKINYEKDVLNFIFGKQELNYLLQF
jgi:hypothetical protein